MNEPSAERPRRSTEVSPFRVLLGVLLGVVILFYPFTYLMRPSGRRPDRVTCVANLRSLSASLMIYAQEHGDVYPTAERWCDLLVDAFGEQVTKTLCCPKVKNARCSYALNPKADPNGAYDVVLLFGSEPGWNQSGGMELLTTERHGDRCNVLFVGGYVQSVKLEDVPDLKWEGMRIRLQGANQATSSNARRPDKHEEMEYWLDNMISYHRFTTEEVRAAMGIKNADIRWMQRLLGISPGDRPERDADAPVLVLPYPGGRHPRIGFLEGAIDPQRETKFSVFTPWDPNSYVVVDVPEAIWSNLGLTYLAHTHIDTIWTKQGIELPKLEWHRRPDGSLDIERTLPNGIAFGVKVVPDREAVRMEMWLQNGTEEKLSDLRVQICVMTKMAAGFAQQTNENKAFTNPYVACRSEDGKRWIITAWERCERPWGNEDCPCFHSDPKFPDLEAGQKHVLRGWLSFYEGDDVQAEFRRIEATGWREN